MLNNLEFFKNLPPEITAIFVSIFGDIKIVVPFYAAQGNLAWWNVVIVSIIGNSISAIFLLTILNALSRFLMRKFSFWDKFFSNLFRKTKLKHTKTFEKWGETAIFLVTAIPLPGFGGWTGVLVSFVFGIKYKKAVFWVVLGIIVEAIIMALLSFGVKNIF